VSGGERQFTTPGGIRLGPLEIIPDGTARSFVVQLQAGRFHGFVVRRGGQVVGYVDSCPHMGLPLARVLDDYLTLQGTSSCAAGTGHCSRSTAAPASAGPAPAPG
jgi:nitrite reductase/ring-hydroxylating ferredoxin subunit